jgi:hypothetical protein
MHASGRVRLETSQRLATDHGTSVRQPSRYIPRYAAVLIAAGILSFQLFLPPPVGLANNGDFGKIIGVFSLGGSPDDSFAYAPTKYRFDPKHHWDAPYKSTESLFAGLAIGLNALRSSDGTFDIRFIGFTHAALVVTGVYLLYPLLAPVPVLSRFAILALIALVLGDVMYVAPLNSFYMDAATYLFLLLAVVFFLRAARWRHKSDAVLFVLCVVLMVLSKKQHALLGLWVAGLLAWLGVELWPGKGRRFALVAAVLIVVAVVVGFNTVPRDYSALGYYSVIFIQILPNSDNVEGDLAALGLDDSYRKWIGTHAYGADAGMRDLEFQQSFMRRTSYGRVAWFFLTHPRAAYLALTTSVAEGGRQRAPFGNFDRSAGLPPYAESRSFAMWSDAKRRLFHGHGVRYLCSLALVSVFLCGISVARRKALPRVCVAGSFALAGMGGTALLIAALADAVEVARHYMIATAVFDLQLLCALALLLTGVRSRTKHVERNPVLSTLF